MGGVAVRVTFDSAADAAFIYLVDSIRPGAVAQTHVCDLEIEGAAGSRPGMWCTTGSELTLGA